MGGLGIGIAFAPIAGHPALLIGGKEPAVVIADLHLGYSDELEDKGMFIGKQSEQMLAELELISSRAGRLIMLGDLKHAIGYTRRRSDLPAFMAELMTYYERVDVVPGNHDGMISRSLPQRVMLHSTEGFADGEVSYCHGHAWPASELMKSRLLVMGHVHPAVRFVDSLGNRYVEKCWLRVPFRKEDPEGRYGSLPAEMIVIPAFNPLLTGTPVNTKQGKGLGPILKEGLVRLTKGRIYLLDGTYLGTVSENAQ